MSAERPQVGDLLTDTRLYRTSAAQSGNILIADVLDELERVLIELRHSPEQMSAGDIDRLRQSLDEQGTLFKIRVLNSQIRQQQRTSLQSVKTETF
jgi:hypothetical protein